MRSKKLRALAAGQKVEGERLRLQEMSEGSVS